MTRKYKYLTTYLLIVTLCFAIIALANIPNVQGKKSGFKISVSNPDNGDLPYAVITPPGQAIFNVEVTHISPPGGVPVEAIGLVELSYRGVPSGVHCYFSDGGMGLLLPDESINFEALVSVAGGVAPDIYDLVITVESKQKRKALIETTVGLEISGDSVAPKGTSELQELTIDLWTDKLTYNPGDTVIIEGKIKDPSGNSASGASVSLEVLDPNGASVYENPTVVADTLGFFNETVTLAADVINGEYTVYAQATYLEYSGMTHSSFVVGASSTPVISILGFNITDEAGNQDVKFESGDRIVFTIQVTNQGEDLEGAIIWLELQDPLGTPLFVNTLTSTLSQGELVTIELQVNLPADLIEGEYLAAVYVSEAPVSQGGEYFDYEERSFFVESTFVPDNLPSVSFVDPVEAQQINKTTDDTYQVVVEASDDDQVTLVQLKIDDGSWMNITGTFNGTHYVYIWNITDVTEEIHTLTANATDSAAQNATDQVTVDIVAASEST